MRTLGLICSFGLAAVLFFLCVGVLAIRMIGMGAFVVTGGSMEPAIHKGALAVVEPVSPQVIERGDVITFEHYGQMTTHRVIAIDRSGATPVFTTKGDANAVADPEPVRFSGQVGLYRGEIPLAGYFVAYAQAYWRLALTLAAATVFLGCAATLLFTNLRPRTLRLPRPRRSLTVVVTEHEELWASHIGWLREASERQVRAA